MKINKMIANHNTEDGLSAHEIYRGIDIDQNIYEEIKNGKESIEIGMDFENGLAFIEEFVERVLSRKELAFKISRSKRGRIIIEKLYFGQYYPLMPAFLAISTSDYRHSEHVELFIESSQQLRLYGIPGFGSKIGLPSFKSGLPSAIPGKIDADDFNELIELIREEAKKPKFKARVRERERNARNNYISTMKYQNALFQAYARLMVIRIDFGYLRDHASSVTEESSMADIKRFFNNRRGKRSLFSALVGHILKREWGVDKKFHFHLILYFDGSKVRNDAYLANMIGEYWQKLVKGKGTFFNCNACKNKYKKLGIGMVNHNDTEMRNNLLIAIKYLTKKEQFIHAKKLHSKVVRKGQPPALRTSTAGRPRKEIIDVK